MRWEKYPAVVTADRAGRWLEMQPNLGLAPNTITAYGRALDDYIRFSTAASVDVATAGREHVARWVRNLCERPNAAAAGARHIGLSNATIQQRLTAVRLFYDHLVFEAVRDQIPVGGRVYTPSRAFGVANGQREHRVRRLVRRFEPLPWIPNDGEWRAVLAAIQTKSLRNRTMFALTYDSALRREELCGLQIRDMDVANRMLTIRAETTKGRRTRLVPYGPHSFWAKLLQAGQSLPDDDVHSTGHNYPAAMVRAVALVWLFCGIRRDEIRRLRVGCVQRQTRDMGVPASNEVLTKGSVVFLNVPPNKSTPVTPNRSIRSSPM